MPPFVGWYQGAEAIGRLIEVNCPAGPNELRMVSTRANGQAAFGMYYLTDDGTFRPFQLQVLELRGGEVGHVAAFFDHSLFPVFGLPEHLAAETPLRRHRAMTAQPGAAVAAGTELLERALAYTRGTLALVTPAHLGRTHPL